MFEKFGELNSFGEINELAENLFNEGDTESLKAMAKENGIQSDFVDMYLQGEIPVLCDQLTAALGKIDVEVAELKPKEIMEDWVEYLRGQCMENELLAKHNTGKTYILMLRFKEEPDVPYITVEIDAKNPRILQWYGDKDKKPDEKNMQSWLNTWLMKLKTGTLTETIQTAAIA